MIYSENKNYGRKHIRIKNENAFIKRLVLSWVICFVVGLLVGSGITYGITKWIGNESDPGTYQVVNEASLEWSSSAEDFIPLDVALDEEMQQFIYCLSYGYDIDFPLVMALINEESSFKSDALSKTNDFGLMQINEVNHEWLTKTIGVTDYLDPYENVRSGIFILDQLFEKYEDPEKVLMAYNLGESGASELWKNGVLETRYSNSIMKTAAEYEKEILEKEGEKNDQM